MKNFIEKTKNILKIKMNQIIYTMTIIISLTIIFLLHNYYTSNMKVEIDKASDINIFVGKIIEISNVTKDEYTIGGIETFSTITKFKAKLSKDNKIVTGIQSIDNMITIPVKPVSLGDKITLSKMTDNEGYSYYVFNDYYKLDYLFILIGTFCLLILLFGMKKGLDTLIALILTGLSIFYVFIPSILACTNIYISSIFQCIFITIFTLILISGLSVKSTSAMLGCSFGIIIAGIISYAMIKLMNLTGNIDEHSTYIYSLTENHTLSLTAILFGGIILGALGATMDVSMSISSSLNEIYEKNKNISFKELVTSGLTIGKDVLGTMSNTLILAYIGSSLCSVIVIASLNSPLTLTLNSELIICEILQALAGTIGIIFTIPFTSCVFSFIKLNMHKKNNDTPIEIEDK